MRDGAKPAPTSAFPAPRDAAKSGDEAVEKNQGNQQSHPTHQGPGPEVRIQGRAAAPIDAQQQDRVHDRDSMGIPSSRWAQD